MNLQFTEEHVVWRWENPISHRYYLVIIGQDLFSDWVVTKCWGGIAKPNGHMSRVACVSKESCMKMIQNIAAIRKRRGYILCSVS